MQLLKEMPTVRDIWEVPTYDELAGLLDNFINNVDEEAETSTDTTNDEDEVRDLPSDFYSPEIKPSARKASATSDIDAAFDEMFA
jgi:hypothetical protein